MNLLRPFLLVFLFAATSWASSGTDLPFAYGQLNGLLGKSNEVGLGVYRCPKTRLCCLKSSRCCANGYGCCISGSKPVRTPALPCGKPKRTEQL